VLVEHHVAHAASSYFASPFEQATVLTMDRMGDFRCAARFRAEGNSLTLEREAYYPDSLGDLYARVADLLGFEPAADEHKVQWLSTSGDDRHAALFRDTINPSADGWPQLDRAFFDSERKGAGGFSAKLYERLGLDRGRPISERQKAWIAAGLQAAVERTVLEMAGEAEQLCVGGGLGLNALLISALERSGKQVFVQPAAGNAGACFGAAYYVWHVLLGNSARVAFGNLCFGPSFGPDETKEVLENCKLRFRFLLTGDELIASAVEHIHDDKIVAWMHGQMEFGPRALGNRSILASPLNPYSSENLNVYIKHRESFRKFAASVPAERVAEYFEVGANARYIATVGRVRPEHRARFESAVMGDGLVRVHSVERADNPLFWRLLQAFGERTGLPVLYNTSFNLFGDPLVCTPRDAVRSFYSSGIDAMYVGHFLLEK
jgi:carbamoyltransferase